MMLYLDTSALVKCYFEEPGTKVLRDRTARRGQLFFTSVISFAEVHKAIACKQRTGYLNSRALEIVRVAFKADWALLLNIVQLDSQTLKEVPNLMAKYSANPKKQVLKALDAIHLSAAIWLRETTESRTPFPAGEKLEFGVADRKLANIANECGLSVFNPEEEN